MNFARELNAKLKKDIKDVALAYYAEVLSRRVDKTYDDALWTEAVKIASGFNPQTGGGGVQKIKEKPTILPPNRTANEIETALENITRENFSSIASTTLVDKELFEAIKSGEEYSFTQEVVKTERLFTVCSVASMEQLTLE